MSRFFIDRPIFAWVLAILAIIAGVISIANLPIEQYPKIAPPTVKVQAVYPGADAKTVENSVTQVIEKQLKGLDNLMYMKADSSSNGASNITLTFENGTNADTAQVQVQNKLQSAMSSLPEAVQRQGVNVNKSSGSFLMVYAFTSENGGMSEADIGDYVNTNLVDQISRVEGVGSVQVFGSSYAMRIWLDPEKLRTYSLMPSDIIAAVQSQNAQVSAGQLGQVPTDTGKQVLNATVSLQSYLQTPEEFRNILVKNDMQGGQVRLGDVADVEMGSESYAVSSKYNGKTAAGMGINLATGANALNTRSAVEERMDELKLNFPQGLQTDIPYDTTPFVRLSIEEVVKTLLEAIVLVFLVMLLFLQNWRATIIPTLAVPVVILGTFAVLNIAGYSINVLTMFALVLAIGLLVDDAIVVVENVERILEEDKDHTMTVREATIQSMGEISKVVIGIAVILSAVFVPMAFMSGSTGVIFRQFSITLITSMVLSAAVALVFTPALCVSLLKNKKHVPLEKQKGFFGLFNRGFDRLSRAYERFVGASFDLRVLYGIAYAIIIAVMAKFFLMIPSSFLPKEDQGMMMTLVQLPTGSTMPETQAVMDKVGNYFQDNDNVEGVYTISGYSFMGQGQNMGLAFVRLKDWGERPGRENSAEAIVGNAFGYFMTQFNEAMVFPISPSPIPELGNATGFNLMLQDSGNIGHEKLLEARNMLLGMASQDKKLMGVRPNGLADAPELKVNINQEQAAAYGVPLLTANSVLATAWGSAYVNDFIDRGRIKRVYLQGDSTSRTSPEDINRWYVRNKTGQMIPFGAFATTEWKFGSPKLTRYNSYPAMNIEGSPVPGVSSGLAMSSMEEMITKLPPGVSFEWTGLSLEEQKSGSQAPMLYAISIIIVFLCLAALYESWSIPFAVLMVVPLGVLGAVLLTISRGFANDVYLQVGLLTVVGLSAKNAILIIEFAKELQEIGHSLKESVMTAARQRLRPIIMTSFAFGMGVIPLFMATGAGSGSQTAIGTSVLGGVISATVLGVFFIPMFYIWVRSVFPYKNDKDGKNQTAIDNQCPVSLNATDSLSSEGSSAIATSKIATHIDTDDFQTGNSHIESDATDIGKTGIKDTAESESKSRSNKFIQKKINSDKSADD